MKRSKRLIAIATIAALELALTAISHGQATVRDSLASPTAALRRKSATEPTPALRAGKLRTNADFSLEAEFNDNVNFADPRNPLSSGRKQDLLLRARTSIANRWRLTALNDISFRLGLAYEHSTLGGRQYTGVPITITPDSLLSMDIFVGDFRITPYDQFAMTSNPASNPSVSDTDGYRHVSNRAGIKTLWDLNDIVATLDLQNRRDSYEGRTLEGLDRSTNTATLTTEFRLNDTSTLSIDTSVSQSELLESSITQQLTRTGLTLDAKLSSYTHATLLAGAQHLDTDQQIDNAHRADYEPYWEAKLHHRLNKYYTHTLTWGHEARFGVRQPIATSTYFRYSSIWQVNLRTTFTTNVTTETIEETLGDDPEDTSRLLVSFKIQRRIGASIDASVGYSFIARDSNRQYTDYEQNSLTLGLHIHF